jgi:hypothetical protein
MARPATRVSAAPKAEGAQERKMKIFSIPKGGGIIATIKSEAIIYDPETNTNRQIRYCPNESSIFADEQSNFAVRKHVVFENGALMVQPSEPTLMKFLEMHPGNRANGGGLFEEVNTEHKAEVDINVEFLLHDAIGLVRNKTVDELMPVAIYLGVETNQKNAEIKRELLLEAKSNPKRFIDLFDNPTVAARATVKKAVDFQILLAREDGMYWFDSNRLIIANPVGQDSISVMTQFCLTEKGAQTYETLKQELQKLEM